MQFSVIKNGMADLGMKSPIYIPGPVEPQFGPGRYIYFEGFSVDENGKQHHLDATVAYRQTSLRVIEYLRRYGKRDFQLLPQEESCRTDYHDCYRLRRLPDLPTALLCAGAGAHGWDRGYPQCVHDDGATH